VLELIKNLISEGKNDRQIAEITNLSVYKTWYIRRKILNVSHYEKRIKCAKCGKDKSVIVFSSKSQHPDWCIICRKNAGEETSIKKRGRPFLSDEKRVINTRLKMKCYCQRCGDSFDSEIFVGFDGRPDHYRTCNRCRSFIASIDRISI
jgi:hypothetical protein